MKKFSLAIATFAALIFGLGATAGASVYPPDSFEISATPASGAPGYVVTVTSECLPGDEVTVTLEDETATASCAGVPDVEAFRSAVRTATPDLGEISVELSAPMAAGSYTGSVTGTEAGEMGSFTITVVEEDGGMTGGATDGGTAAGQLPSTGSDGLGTTAYLAGGLLIVGLGLVSVTAIRRRQAPIAS